MDGEAKYWKDKWLEAQNIIKVLRDLLFMRLNNIKVRKVQRKRRK